MTILISYSLYQENRKYTVHFSASKSLWFPSRCKNPDFTLCFCPIHTDCFLLICYLYHIFQKKKFVFMIYFLRLTDFPCNHDLLLLAIVFPCVVRIAQFLNNSQKPILLLFNYATQSLEIMYFYHLQQNSPSQRPLSSVK